MHEYGGDIHFVCLEDQALAKKQFSFKVFTTLPQRISQYYFVTMAAISGNYLKRAYSSKMQHRSLVKVQPSGSQTFMSRGPLLRLTGEYLTYRDT